MPKTDRGIYKDLTKTEYTVTVKETVYFFSSILYMTKFMYELEDNRKRFRTLLKQQRISFLYTDKLADYRLYKRIEKRGFFVEENSVFYEQEKTYIKRMLNDLYGRTGLEY